MFGGIKVNETWKKLYNKELLHWFRSLDILCQRTSVEFDQLFKKKGLQKGSKSSI
jgi:hypothetical protein